MKTEVGIALTNRCTSLRHVPYPAFPDPSHPWSLCEGEREGGMLLPPRKHHPVTMATLAGPWALFPQDP